MVSAARMRARVVRPVLHALPQQGRRLSSNFFFFFLFLSSIEPIGRSVRCDLCWPGGDSPPWFHPGARPSPRGKKGAGHGVGAQPAFTPATSVLGALPAANSCSWVLYEVSYPKDVKYMLTTSIHKT